MLISIKLTIPSTSIHQLHGIAVHQLHGIALTAAINPDSVDNSQTTSFPLTNADASDEILIVNNLELEPFTVLVHVTPAKTSTRRLNQRNARRSVQPTNTIWKIWAAETMTLIFEKFQMKFYIIQ